MLSSLKIKYFKRASYFASSSRSHYNYTVHSNFLWLTGSKNL